MTIIAVGAAANVGSSKNLGRATFRKMPEAGLKIAQKGLKTRGT